MSEPLLFAAWFLIYNLIIIQDHWNLEFNFIPELKLNWLQNRTEIWNVFHNKTCIRSAMESVIEIAGGAPRGLGRSLLGGDLALGIGSIPLVETVKPILINIWSSPVLPVCMADFGS